MCHTSFWACYASPVSVTYGAVLQVSRLRNSSLGRPLRKKSSWFQGERGAEKEDRPTVMKVVGDFLDSRLVFEANRLSNIGCG